MITTTYRSITITVLFGVLGRLGYKIIVKDVSVASDTVRIIENLEFIGRLVLNSNLQNPINNSKKQTTVLSSYGIKNNSYSFNKHDSTNETVCRVYFAPSTIPGAGMGVFAGKTFETNDEIMSPDGVVPLIDIKWNNGGINYESIWGEYVWSGRTFPGMNEPGFHVQGASFGVGAIPNCIFPLVNMEDSTTNRDHAGIVAGNDPGTGAFTEFYNRAGIATRSIRAGEELFVDYGYAYFNDRKDVFGPIPKLKDYKNVDVVLKKFHVLRKTITRIATLQQLMYGSPHQASITVDLYNLSKSIAGLWADSVGAAFPNTLEDVDRVLDEIGTTKMLGYEKIIKDMKLLEDTGACMDHLEVRKSQIPHAGRGAFANKFLREGTVVAPVPLIHYPNRTILNMYHGYINDDGKYKRNVSELVHQQLLLNYCFGHRSTSLLLCPYGIVSSLVNHGADKKQQSNVKIAWSDKIMSQPTWLDLPLKDWAYEFKAGLAFDYIATRDVHAGEEILVDYGDEWEKAWDNHVKTWTPKKRKSQQLNEADPPINIPNANDWRWPDVHLWCHDIFREFQGHPKFDEELVARPCRVIGSFRGKHSDELFYTAEILDRHHDLPEHYEEYKSGTDFCVEDNKGILFNLPRDAFWFAGPLDSNDDARYYRELWSFRHELGIPDDLMPEKWKNKLHDFV